VLDDGRHRTSVKVSFGDTRREIWLVTDPDVPFVDHNRGDLWLPVLLILAMRRGERLRLSDPISAGRRADVRKVQDIFAAWYPKRMTHVKVVAPPAEDRPEPEPKGLLRRRPKVVDTRVSGTCFTGGVDSFNTLVKHKKTLGALVYGFGIDIPVKETEAMERVGKQLAVVAEESGTRLLTAETNIRRFLDGNQVSWGFEGHGAALASLGTVFSTVVSTLYVPSTHSYAVTHPWGSSPLVDPLWSTRRLRIVHDGAESSRVGKIKQLADDATAQRNLRVCYKQFAETNCGRCLKCMRTMATLALLGRLDRFETFTTPLDLDLLRSQVVRTDTQAFLVRDVHELAREVPGHEDIRDTLGSLLDGYQERLAAGLPSWEPGDAVD
jgi:hypothetical protein